MLRIWKYLLGPLLFFSYSTSLFSQDLKQISQNSEWHFLLHYKKNIFGFYKSEQDKKSFFISKEGKESPLEELKATIEAFSRDTKRQCQFPARANFLKKFNLIKKSKISCPQLDSWRQALKTKSISLIFSTAYPGSPPSVFGHTFLRMNSKNNQRRSPLLDLGLNFAASTPPDEHPLVFGFKGLLGGYKGYYALDKYYKKVKEYLHMEGRDLWEYQLPLTKNEIYRFENHLYELLYQSEFDYFFMTENCSYQLLWLLAYARPSTDLLNTRSLYVLPSETVKSIKREFHSYTSEKQRTNDRWNYQDLYNQLPSQKKKIVKMLISKDEVFNHVDDVEILDVYINFKNYQKNKKGLAFTKEERKKFSNLLTYRSKLKRKNKLTPRKNPLSNPLGSHNPGQIKLGLTWQHGKQEEVMAIAPLKHSNFDIDQGYIPNSHFEFLGIEARKKENRVFIEKFNFIKVRSLTPVAAGSYPLSWNARIFYENTQFSCNFCKAWGGLASLGQSFGSPLGTYQFYYFLKTKLAYTNQEKNFLLDLGPELGLFLKPIEKVKFHSSLGWISNLIESRPISHITSYNNLGIIFTPSIKLVFKANYYYNIKKTSQNIWVGESSMEYSF